MKATICFLALCLTVNSSAAAQSTGFQDPLLDHFTGNWVLRGTIAGGEKTHDIDAEWVLGHRYLRFHEVSREVNEDGSREYEATVYIGWDEEVNQYACLWLDSTGNGLKADVVIGHAQKNAGDELAFIFKDEDSSFHTTFAYNRKSDSWEWRMDSEKDGMRTPFARATMTKSRETDGDNGANVNR